MSFNTKFSITLKFLFSFLKLLFTPTVLIDLMSRLYLEISTPGPDAWTCYLDLYLEGDLNARDAPGPELNGPDLNA